MAYLHIGQNVMLEDKRIIGIFDLDNTSTSKITREFLNTAEQDSVVQTAMPQVAEVAREAGIPVYKSFVVCDHPYHRQIIYISQLNSQTLLKRAQGKGE